MQQTLEDLIKFCESRQLKEVAAGLKKDLDKNRFVSAPREINTLKIIRDALQKEDHKQMAAKTVNNKKSSAQKTQAVKPNSKRADDNKEANEEIMERFMNRVVAKESFLKDDALNSKIEKIMDLNLFTKLVENADVFQDLSNSSMFNNSDVQGQNPAFSYMRLLPTHSQIKEDLNPDNLPRFGKILEEDMEGEQYLLGQNKELHDDINESVERLLASGTPAAQSEKQLVNDDSFSNLQPAVENSQKLGEELVPEVALKLSMIEHNGDHTITAEGASFFQNQSMFVFGVDPSDQHPMNKEAVDEYVDDDDPGFDTYVVNEENFVASCTELAELNNFPARAIKPDTALDKKNREKKRQEFKEKELMGREKKTEKSLGKDDSGVMLDNLQKSQKAKKKLSVSNNEDASNDKDELDEDDGRKVSVLPRWIKFMPSNDEFYPAEFDDVIYDCYNLRVVFDREKTGFEESKEFPIVVNSIVAGRYQVIEYLGSAAFSKAIQCYDIHTEQMVCMKIIENNKDYFDQSVDEIKLLRYINANCEDLDQKNLLKLIDFFYHKEHLFIVTELLRDNLYEYSKYNREVEKSHYFNVPRLQKITKQILTALSFIHNLKLVHCDLKPENILIKSYSRSEVKVIDFGSSCFIHDHLSSYVQSRSYRAPEVILGCKYDYKIDMWSLGCILAELFTGYVLFQNDSVQGLLARVISIIGPIPEYMMKEGRLVSNFFTREGLIYQESKEDEEDKESKKRRQSEDEMKIHILVAKRTTLKQRLNCDDQHFVDFVRWLLETDPIKRPSANEALTHPWLTECQYNLE